MSGGGTGLMSGGGLSIGSAGRLTSGFEGFSIMVQHSGATRVPEQVGRPAYPVLPAKRAPVSARARAT